MRKKREERERGRETERQPIQIKEKFKNLKPFYLFYPNKENNSSNNSRGSGSATNPTVLTVLNGEREISHENRKLLFQLK